MSYKYLKVTNLKKNVFQVVLNNPDTRNALNSVILDEVIVCLEKLNKEKLCRALIITGVDKSFSSGADLEWMKKSIDLSIEDNKKDALKFSKMLKTIDDFYCPTIAIINGHAFGGGLGIISVCDFTIADIDSKFCFSEVKLGLIPAMIGPYILRSIGYIKTKQLFLTGEIFDASKAIKYNFINIAVKKENIIEERNKLIDKILLGGPKAQSEIKSYLQNIYNKNIDDILINNASDSIARIRVSDEGQEGISAFLTKSKPKWQDDIS